jgi:transposase
MKHKSEDYKLSAVEYYLVEDNTQEEVCKIFKCSPRSLMRWVEKYNIKRVKNQIHHHRHLYFFLSSFY